MTFQTSYRELAFKVSQDTAERLDKSADRTGMTIGRFVIEAIKAACARREAGYDPFDREEAT